MPTISYAEALAAIAALPITAATERVALAAAAGRVAGEEVRLAGDQPPFDRATMDGFAAVLAPGTTSYRVVGTVHAGETFAGALAPGEAVRIMTGAPAPAGTTVIPYEATDRGTAQVAVTDAKALAPRRNIAWRGEDGRAGALVIAPGTRLAPALLALAAMAGVTAISVARPPRVAIVTTGDEVGGGGSAGILDSNGPFLSGFCAALGLECTRTHAEDDADALRRVLTEHGADIVVTTGGVSAGDRDLVPRIAAELGFATVFHQVAMQPGKPVLLARRGERFLVGLPGNPVSVLATAHLVLLPLLQRLLGRGASPWLELPLAVPWQHRGARQLFLPARVVAGGISPVRWNGSGDLIAAAAADGLVDLAPRSEHAAGAVVRFLPYVGHTMGERGVMPERVGRG